MDDYLPFIYEVCLPLKDIAYLTSRRDQNCYCRICDQRGSKFNCKCTENRHFVDFQTPSSTEDEWCIHKNDEVTLDALVEAIVESSGRSKLQSSRHQFFFNAKTFKPKEPKYGGLIVKAISPKSKRLKSHKCHQFVYDVPENYYGQLSDEADNFITKPIEENKISLHKGHNTHEIRAEDKSIDLLVDVIDDLPEISDSQESDEISQGVETTKLESYKNNTIAKSSYVSEQATLDKPECFESNIFIEIYPNIENLKLKHHQSSTQVMPENFLEETIVDKQDHEPYQLPQSEDVEKGTDVKPEYLAKELIVEGKNRHKSYHETLQGTKVSLPEYQETTKVNAKIIKYDYAESANILHSTDDTLWTNMPEKEYEEPSENKRKDDDILSFTANLQPQQRVETRKEIKTYTTSLYIRSISNKMPCFEEWKQSLMQQKGRRKSVNDFIKIYDDLKNNFVTDSKPLKNDQAQNIGNISSSSTDTPIFRKQTFNCISKTRSLEYTRQQKNGESIKYFNSTPNRKFKNIQVKNDMTEPKQIIPSKNLEFDTTTASGNLIEMTSNRLSKSLEIKSQRSDSKMEENAAEDDDSEVKLKMNLRFEVGIPKSSMENLI